MEKGFKNLREINRVFYDPDQITIEEMEKVKPICPHCGSDDLRKLISSGRIRIGLGGYAGKVR